MKILISGASGFVGKNVALSLKEKGHSIVAISRNPGDNYEISWDQFFDGPPEADAIIHLAGKAHDIKKTSNADEYFEVNTELTKKLFNTFLAGKSSTFIFMSSVKAAADTVNGVLTEDAVPDPQTPYGQSKRKAEEYILSRPLPLGKRVFILRPCMIHGPGNKGNLNLLYQFVLKGIPYPLAAYQNERSFLSIDNLNFIIEQLVADASIPGGLYNLADDTPLSTNKLISIIAGVNGVEPRIWKISPAVINFFARAGDIFKLPLNSERLKKLTESYVVSNEKIKRALHIKNLPLLPEDGLKLTIQSFCAA